MENYTLICPKCHHDEVELVDVQLSEPNAFIGMMKCRDCGHIAAESVFEEAHRSSRAAAILDQYNIPPWASSEVRKLRMFFIANMLSEAEFEREVQKHRREEPSVLDPRPGLVMSPRIYDEIADKNRYTDVSKEELERIKAEAERVVEAETGRKPDRIDAVARGHCVKINVQYQDPTPVDQIKLTHVQVKPIEISRAEVEKMLGMFEEVRECLDEIQQKMGEYEGLMRKALGYGGDG